MKFLLNDKLIDDNTLPSDFTALRYLREKRGLTGTKEGCASGDCGACTLLVGVIKEGELHYSTFNSCITPVQSLSGKHVVSVEYLSEFGGRRAVDYILLNRPWWNIMVLNVVFVHRALCCPSRVFMKTANLLIKP
ncbi:hypothetical protein [Marinomonas primoryensis]|uniref:hypothetical protein n=1 Tax=Marinomonas primoryensis TaxID=178399 RepID=UPI001EF76B61|nr:hypothetical protein [Marinomonas primoryensis]